NDKKKITYIIHQVQDVTEIIKLTQKSLNETRQAKEELEEKLALFKNNDARITNIMNVLLNYTMLDFTEHVQPSDKGDELDAIAVGLNTLSEELQSYINQIKENDTQIKQANEQLEAANKELESFSYSISHDLRAPLRAIHGYTKILEEDYYNKLDKEGKDTIQAVLRNSKRMGELIDDLLAFSRLGKKELSTDIINMDMLMHEVCAEVISPVAKHKVTLEIARLPPANGDYTLIRQVLINLVSNAVKFSSTRSISRIEIGAQNKGDFNEYFIRDNGIGFDMRYYNKLFGVFQRLHAQEDFSGTGVGLAIVKRIIQKHNGGIWAESELNKGTIFYFTLLNSKHD
ncbi:MAG TPA: ATP-binding protein, partial [Flavobacteriales bacterium]|nr:ATP-binding protein [Flavobacteriales bacterium]